MSTFYDYSLKSQGDNLSGKQFLIQNKIFSNLSNFMYTLNNSLKYSLGESNKYLDIIDISNIKLAFEKTYQKENSLYLQKNLYVYRCYKEKVSYSLIRNEKKIGRFLSTTLNPSIAHKFCNQEPEIERKILNLSSKHVIVDDIIGETVEIISNDKLYYGIIINVHEHYLKLHLFKKYYNTKSKDNSNIQVFRIDTIRLSVISNLFNICIQIPKNSSGVLPILLYCNYEDTQPPPNNYFLAISSDNFSKSESPKDYYNEILLDYKGNLVPVYKRLKDPIFKKKDILIHNNCPVFKYQDRNHNNNFNKKTSNKIRLRSLKKTRLDYHYLDSMKTIKRLKQYIFN